MARPLHGLEALERRTMYSVTAEFNSDIGVLTAFGDDLGNEIIFDVTDAGAIVINDGQIDVVGGTPTIFNTNLIRAAGRAGDDTVALLDDELPRAVLFGGDGDDIVIGGAGRDLLFGGFGNDLVRGGADRDTIHAGHGNDVAIGDEGNDVIRAGGGDDGIILFQGDGSDFIWGQDGFDEVGIAGSDGADDIQIGLTRGYLSVAIDGPAPAVQMIDSAEKVIVDSFDGDDVITIQPGLPGLTAIHIDGGAGNDIITGAEGDDMLMGGQGDDVIEDGAGDDQIFGGAGDDTLIGDDGDDTAFGEAGRDTFLWFEGHGSDLFIGGADRDAINIRTGDADDEINIKAEGPRLMVSRPLDDLRIDVETVESVTLSTFAGDDRVFINDLSGIGLEILSVNGGLGNDVIQGADCAVSLVGRGEEGDDIMFGGSADDIFFGDEGVDIIIAGDGDDSLSGGDDNDQLLAGPGNDVLFGGDGHDDFKAGAGDDILLGGEGNDFLDGGDDTDFIDGGAGQDTAINGETVINIP